MNIEQIQEFINEAAAIPVGHYVAVTQFNRSTYYGIFEIFKDSEELKKQNKWRFIPIDRMIGYYEELNKIKLSNPDYSLIIEGESISKLELVKK